MLPENECCATCRFCAVLKEGWVDVGHVCTVFYKVPDRSGSIQVQRRLNVVCEAYERKLVVKDGVG